MIGKAVIKYARMSPRKVRYVMEPLRRRTVAEALGTLMTMNRRASQVVAKAIGSAVANAKQTDATVVEEGLIISRLTADGGPVWKRFRAAAFGRAVPIRKPTTHITVEVDRIARKQPRAVSQPAAAKGTKASRLEGTRAGGPREPGGRGSRPGNK